MREGHAIMIEAKVHVKMFTNHETVSKTKKKTKYSLVCMENLTFSVEQTAFGQHTTASYYIARFIRSGNHIKSSNQF